MTIEFRHDLTPIAYPDAMAIMSERVEAVIEGKAPEMIWFLEHTPCYTAGTSAKSSDLRDPMFPVYETGRGGQYTYHGPGQQVVYFILDLKKRQQEPDLRQFVHDLEQVVIKALSDIGLKGEVREGRVGVWVKKKHEENKIAALGIRVRRWVTSHGLSLNVDPFLDHYNGIVPCGIAEFGITSLRDMGKDTSMEQAAALLKKRIESHFGL